MAKVEKVVIEMPRNEWKLLAALLKMAADQFDNHGCNDLPDDLIRLLPESRWREIAIEIADESDPWLLTATPS